MRAVIFSHCFYVRLVNFELRENMHSLIAKRIFNTKI